MATTASGSFSWATSRPDLFSVDLTEAGLPPLPTAWLAGRDRDLLEPLGFVRPEELARLPPPRSGAGTDRRELAAALAVANRAYGHPKADELAARLADPATRVVVTGQQPGFLGGPLYSLSKMVAAARWAEALSAAGQPAVAVFWVATEDHDWAEVATATVPTPEGPRALGLGDDPEPLTPVGMRTFGPAVTGALAELAAAVPGEFYGEWVETLGRWYRPDARFGEAFCRLMAHLLGERCPLFLDAMLPALKSAERPWLRRLVERRDAVEAAYAARDREIEARGFPLQVAPQRGASPLFFLHRGERRRIEWREGDRFVLRGREEERPISDLLAAIEDNPGVISPGALARPAVQDAVLGSCLQVLGPGEASYMAQTAAVYPVLEIPPPGIALRPQVVILESKQAERLAELQIPLSTLLGDPRQLEREIARKGTGAEESADPVAPVRQRIEAELDRLREAALPVDPNLEKPYDKTREQILRNLDLFGEKVISAAARRNEVVRSRAEQLRQAALPGGKLQERVISAAHFQGKYGPRLAEALWEQLDLDPTHLQGITL